MAFVWIHWINTKILFQSLTTRTLTIKYKLPDPIKRPYFLSLLISGVKSSGATSGLVWCFSPCLSWWLTNPVLKKSNIDYSTLLCSFIANILFNFDCFLYQCNIRFPGATPKYYSVWPSREPRFCFQIGEECRQFISASKLNNFSYPKL